MFVCYYCGDSKAAHEASDEHIIPSCIGGNRNVTLTRDVCADCNQFAGDNIDRPFCRDWVMQSLRLIAGVSHKGKRPIAYRGELRWDRPERVRVYLLEGGAHVAVFDCEDGSRALLVLLPPEHAPTIESVLRVLETRFAGTRVLNGMFPLRRYDHELFAAFLAVDASTRLHFSIDLNTWQAEVVKMALGLASQVLGPGFVASSAAGALREYLREPDPARRNAMGLRGRGGPLFSEPRTTQFVHPGADEHLFLISASGPRLWFEANFFGRHENCLLLDESGSFSARLPAYLEDHQRGFAWIVDPVHKKTEGPIAIAELLARSLR